MATTPYTESGLIASLRSRGISSSDIDDDALGTIIADSLSEYMAFKPKMCITSGTTCITTVADQPNYELPTDALWVSQVFWQPGYSSDEMEDVWTDIILGSQHETDPSMIMLDHIKMARYNQLFQGFWEIRNDEIWLKPCPDDVYKVAVVYATGRTLDELDQIKDFRFRDLCYYSAMLAAGTSKLLGGGWKAGSYSISESVGRETVKVAENGLEKTRLLLANNYRAGRS